MVRKAIPPGDVDFNTLKTVLLQAKLQSDNPPLYQVLEQLITRVAKTKEIFQGDITTIEGDISTIDNSIENINIVINNFTVDITALLNAAYATVDDESALLPNSRELLAGIGITFDDSVANQRTIDATVTDYVVMSDGATPIPSPVDDGFGNFIYIAYTP